MKLRALPHFALDPDAAAMNFDKMFGDGEAQAGAANFAGPGHVNSVEALEDAKLIRPRDADPGVGNGESHFGAVRGSADHDLAAGRSVLQGVVQQILQNFGKTAAVSGNVRQRLLQIHGDTQIFFGGGTLRGLDAALDELRDAQAADLQFQPVGVHFREHEQILGKPRETPGVFENNFEEADTILRIVDGPGEKRFRETLDGGKRRAQLVRNVGDEIAAHALEFAQFGDVVQHDHRAGGFRGADRCDSDRKKMLAQRAGHDFGFDAGLAFQYFSNRFNQLSLADNLKERAAGSRRHVQAKNSRETFI